MGGFGGALKNISIGIASTHGKTNIHTAGVTTEAAELFNNLPPQDHFLESMAEDSASLVERIESRNGLHTLEYAEDIGLGSRTYELINIDN